MDITILLEEFCDENGYTFYPDYSGRGMYGKTCLGIGLDADITPFKLGLELAEFAGRKNVEVDELLDWLGRSCMDSMGLGSIIYFPGTIER